MLTVEQERSPLIETDVGGIIQAVTFSANGKNIVGGTVDFLILHMVIMHKCHIVSTFGSS
jgi:type III secretory pathway component EscV